jgi:hypothetical protein
MQGARYESGLDNSPMYDGDFFADGLMQLYDVGMASMHTMDTAALAKLATVIGTCILVLCSYCAHTVLWC